MNLLVGFFEIIVADALLVASSAGQTTPAFGCVESESLGVLPIGSQFLHGGSLGFLDFFHEFLDELGAAEISFWLPSVVLTAPALPVNQEISSSVLFYANFYDAINFVFLLAVNLPVTFAFKVRLAHGCL